ncbi:transposase [Pseudomonas sp. 21LCFQ02]|uniref:transposase n=1 Tax=Pseudomonas sp. 21LCFQ02 TaxID=2957505 RepID=UPI00209B910A|nr:transposase [Pseudomonas sp. 21LCFQ02]MCO8166752.1 transposase [Pseudomonas sp. 21LCFQ02]
MIRIDMIWLATEPMDMRAGTETALARVIAVFGVWLAARRLNQGKFNWPGIRHGAQVELDSEQVQARIVGLPWQRMGANSTITRL